LGIAQQAYANLACVQADFAELVPIERQISSVACRFRETLSLVTAPAAERLLFSGYMTKGCLNSRHRFRRKQRQTRSFSHGKWFGPFGANTCGIACTRRYAARADRADLAIRYAEPFWKKIPQDYLFNFAPHDVVTLLYPAPFKAALLQEAPKRGVDPRFVLSIGRQESRFKTSAKSGAAARGFASVHSLNRR